MFPGLSRMHLRRTRPAACAGTSTTDAEITGTPKRARSSARRTRGNADVPSQPKPWGRLSASDPHACGSVDELVAGVLGFRTIRRGVITPIGHAFFDGTEGLAVVAGQIDDVVRVVRRGDLGAPAYTAGLRTQRAWRHHGRRKQTSVRLDPQQCTHTASAGSKNSARHRAYESSDRLLAAVGSRTSPPLPAASAFRQLVGGGDRPLVTARAAAPGEHDAITVYARDRFDMAALAASNAGGRHAKVCFDAGHKLSVKLPTRSVNQLSVESVKFAQLHRFW